MYDFYVGIDLGQVNDWTAVAVVEEPVWIGSEPAPDFDRTAMWPIDGRRGWTSVADLVPAQRDFFRARSYAGDRPDRPPLMVRHLERTRHRSYVQVADELAALLTRPPLAGAQVAVLVDATGVGRGVVDYLHHIGVRLCSITITGGNEVHGSVLSALSVPKRELVVATQIALQQGRLRIAAGLPEAATLTRELADYRVKISQSGHDTYNAREGQHDDLVLAVSMTCWYRDYVAQHFDDAIAARRRPAATRG